MTPDKQIAIGQLIALGIQEQEANHICGGSKIVKWTELAKRDGRLALEVLTDAEFDRIKNELIDQGLPAEPASTPNGIVGAIVALAHSTCPRGEWYDTGLVSSVACSILIRLAQTAWGHDELEAKRQESEAFAAKVLQGVH